MVRVEAAEEAETLGVAVAMAAEVATAADAMAAPAVAEEAVAVAEMEAARVESPERVAAARATVGAGEGRGPVQLAEGARSRLPVLVAAAVGEVKVEGMAKEDLVVVATTAEVATAAERGWVAGGAVAPVAAEREEAEARVEREVVVSVGEMGPVRGVAVQEVAAVVVAEVKAAEELRCRQEEWWQRWRPPDHARRTTGTRHRTGSAR
jgi:hypothetical protein